VATETHGLIPVDELGSPAGFPLIMHHGTPGGRLLPGWWHEPAAERQLRVIGFDRPGYGERAARPGRSVADVADDVALLADQLGLERFATMGFSGGGPHALATGALLPDRVVAVATVAGVGPYGAPGLDFLQGMGEANVVEFGLALEGAEKLEPFLQEEAASIVAADVDTVISAMETLLSPPDRAALTGRTAEYLLSSARDALRGGIAGWRDDDLAFTRPWGFDLEQLTVPVSIWQGEQDLMVPQHHAPWLAARIPAAELHVLPDEGHVTLAVTRIGSLLDWVAERCGP
jgi:pimeloyl-ACP methyl ester carboxylesterase